MALPTTPGTNCWTQAEDLLGNLLSECAEMLPFLGVATPQEARDGNMYIDSIGSAPEQYEPAEWAAKFPNVLLGTPGGEASSFVLTPRSTGPNYAATGIIQIRFSQFAPAGILEAEQERGFKNSVGTILQQLTDQPMVMQTIGVATYGRNEKEDHETMGVIQMAVVDVPWGTESESGD